MFVLEKTSDVHGEGLKVRSCGETEANRSGLPDLMSQSDLDSSGVSSTPKSIVSQVLQRLDKLRISPAFACKGRVQITQSQCSTPSIQ